MQQELKQEIAQAAIEYAKAKKLSQADISKITRINSGYLSSIMRFQFTTDVNGKPSPISDKHFHKLAAFVGLSIKKTYWKTHDTRQSVEIATALMMAKENGSTAMLIGSTGIGKTKTIDLFCHKFPAHTYRITVSSAYKLNDIIQELAELLGVDFNNGLKHTQKGKIDMIADKLRNISHNGGNPIVIFDEAENLKMPVINMLKGLYDLINKYCSIVLIGTSQLLIKLTHTRKNSLDAVPQFYRRFKVGLRKISAIEKSIDFKPFYEAFVPDKNLRQLLTQICDNYGDLNGYLEPALKEADETNQPLTEDSFRLMYNLPKY